MDLAFEEMMQVLDGNKEVISVNILPLTSPTCHHQEAVVWLLAVSTYAISTSLTQNSAFQLEYRNEGRAAEAETTGSQCPLE